MVNLAASPEIVSRRRARWARLGSSAGIAGMAAWVIGTALIPMHATLEHGVGDLAATIGSHHNRLYLAALLAVAGGVLLAAMFTTLTLLAPEGDPGSGWLRVSLTACAITQTMVAVGAIGALVAIHTAAYGGPADTVVLGWRVLWLAFRASAVPTLLFTATGILGMHAAGLVPRWVGAMGWISFLAHVLVLFTLAQSGPFAPDGIVGALVPLTTVVWIVAVALTMPRRIASQPRGSQASAAA